VTVDPLTHTLAGLATAHAGFRQRLGRPAVIALTAGALTPDLDNVVAFWDQFSAIKYHRGLTHSVSGGMLLALLVAWPIYRWGTHKRYRDLAALAYLGILLHIGLDLITSFGTMVLYPLTSTRFAGDLAFIVDPLLAATMAVPLIVAWRRPHLAIRAARIGMVAAVLYLVVAAGAKSAAKAHFARELDRRVITADRIVTLPTLFSPFRWTAIAESADQLFRATVTPGSVGDVDLHLYRQAPRNMYVERSDAMDSVRRFRAFARVPWTRYLTRGEEHIVEYHDLSFGAERRVHDMVLRVVMNASGVVESVDFNHRF
jgi:inner membrane protein